MNATPPLSVVFSFRSPGKFALTVLAGAIEAAARPHVRLLLPRTTQSLIDTIAQELDAGRRVIAGWSFYSPSFPECAEELAVVRAALRGRDFLTIAGGVHATAETEQTLDAGFDLVCVGEGERVVLALIDGVAVEAVPGCARRVDGKTVRTPKPPRVELDEFPPFADREGYFGPIEITRGCIYACRFCQTPFFSKAKFRHRSVENVAHWAEVMRRAGKRDLRFISPTSLSYGSEDEAVHLDRVEALLARAKEALGPEGRVFFGTFPSEVRPEHVTSEALALIKRYCHNDNLVIGGQSGSDRVLEASRRGHDAESIVRAAHIATENGFTPNVDFILGLPGETAEDVDATIRLMERLASLGAKVHAHTFMPLPGTPFRDAPPGQISAEALEALERLAGKQQLYGQWKAQIAIAEGIAQRRPQR